MLCLSLSTSGLKNGLPKHSNGLILRPKKGFVKGKEMDSSEIVEKETAQTIPCPPSISKAVWDSVPADEKANALEFAAKCLRRAIHPEKGVVIFLKRRGIYVDYGE
jgi:hypothetical protein